MCVGGKGLLGWERGRGGVKSYQLSRTKTKTQSSGAGQDGKGLELLLGESHPAVAVTSPHLHHQPSYSGVRCRRGRESTEESGEIKHKSNFFHWA